MFIAVPKSNWKILEETEVISMLKTHMHDQALSLFGMCPSVQHKSGGVILVVHYLSQNLLLEFSLALFA
jgi:hypothetical protein